MTRVLWVTVMPIVVLVVPWIGAWVTQGRRQAAFVAGLWLVCVLMVAFVAMGPGLMFLLGLGLFQLARTPWRAARP